jgi:hypothetical protein
MTRLFASLPFSLGRRHADGDPDWQHDDDIALAARASAANKSPRHPDENQDLNRAAAPRSWADGRLPGILIVIRMTARCCHWQR